MYKALLKAFNNIVTQNLLRLYTAQPSHILSQHTQHRVLHCFTLAHELDSGTHVPSAADSYITHSGKYGSTAMSDLVKRNQNEHNTFQPQFKGSFQNVPLVAFGEIFAPLSRAENKQNKTG